MQYKNIIFDLGVVLLDVDYNLAAAAFRKLGIPDFDAHYSKAQQDRFFDRFETGHMTDEEFRIKLRQYLPSHVTNHQIDEAWNAMLLKVPEENFQLLEKLNKSKRIFLLSNTNRIHIRAFSKIIDLQYGFEKFERLFEKAYYSCNIGLRKPDAEIFDLVVKENQLDLSETIFIDDSPQHIEGARNYGLNVVLLKQGDNLSKIVGEL